MVNKLIGLQYNDAEVFPWFGTMGENFNYSSLRGKAASMAIAIDRSNASKTLDLMLNLIENDIPFPGVVGFRYVKGTNATLGFTKFENTCVIELDGVDSKLAHDFYKLFWKTLEANGVPFTLHWGKINHYINKTNLKKMYGTQKINKWLKARSTVLQRDDIGEVFTNEFMENCGLDKWIDPPNVPVVV